MNGGTLRILPQLLCGTCLDWAVANAEGHMVGIHSTGAVYLISTPYKDKKRIKWVAEYSPSRSWAQGGPIIQREQIDIMCKNRATNREWIASRAAKWYKGNSALEAAMRCYVSYKFGEVVEVPKELLC